MIFQKKVVQKTPGPTATRKSYERTPMLYQTIIFEKNLEPKQVNPTQANQSTEIQTKHSTTGLSKLSNKQKDTYLKQLQNKGKNPNTPLATKNAKKAISIETKTAKSQKTTPVNPIKAEQNKETAEKL